MQATTIEPIELIPPVEPTLETQSSPVAKDMPTNDLEEYVRQSVVGVCQSLVDLKPFIEELWKRFDNLSIGEEIAGCATRKEYCGKILKRSPRAVRYMLSGGNPVIKRKAGETVSAPAPGEPQKPAPKVLTSEERYRKLHAAVQHIYTPAQRNEELAEHFDRLIKEFV